MDAYIIPSKINLTYCIITYCTIHLDINPCADNPCENHGHCTHDGKGKVSCICRDGFRGDRCSGRMGYIYLVTLYFKGNVHNKKFFSEMYFFESASEMTTNKENRRSNALSVREISMILYFVIMRSLVPK